MVSLWQGIESLDNKVADEVQSLMLIDTSRQLERGTKWFLRSRRLVDDMGVTIEHFTSNVGKLAARLPQLLDADERARIEGAAARYVAGGVPRELAERVVTFGTLYATLDIAEIAGSARWPVELVAAIYFDLANALGMPWLRDKITALPGDQHWQMLAKGAMLDDLWGLQRSITAAVLAGGADVDSPAALVEAWQASNGRTIERAGQLLGELRAVPAPDAAMLAVALRELRGLT